MSAPHVENFFKFLSIPSISTDPAHREDVRACASWLQQHLESIGLEVQLWETAGHPGVVARNRHQVGRRTVLIYGHYDVQPVDPVELWRHSPFDPQVENGLVVARGASDNKGQLFAHICGIQEALAQTSSLPVNLILLFEGEEEIGSPHLRRLLEEHRHELACDVIVVSDTTMVAPGVPTLTYGMRGLAALEVKVTGPSTDLHSGAFGGAVVNPAAVLARLLAGLHDSQWHVQAPGFYDDVAPLQAWERKAWASLPLNDSELLRMSGAPQLDGEAGFTSLERLWARPTVEINGVTSGYQGAGTKTVLPSVASAKLTCRLVPNQVPAKALECVEAYLLEKAPPSVRVEIQRGHSGEPYLVDPHQVYGKAAQAALRETFGTSNVALIREGGSIPILTDFKQVLGADTLLLGLGLPDCNAHAPNETFPLAHLELGARLNQILLRNLAAVQ